MVRSIKGKHPQYYEAVLQLRSVTDEVIEFVKKEIVKIPVAKMVKIKNGIDYYLADNDFTKALGKKLQQKFGGQQQVTASLFSKKDGKEIYRVTVLYRGVNFKKGDLVEYQGSEYTVKLLGKELMLQETKTGKKIHVKYKNTNRIKKIG